MVRRHGRHRPLARVRSLLRGERGLPRTLRRSGGTERAALHPPSYPDGIDVEIISLDALEQAHREATRDFEREHTTPFLWERPERFRIANVTSESGNDLSKELRLTLDYPEDHALLAAVFEAMLADVGIGFSSTTSSPSSFVTPRSRP